jgi:hypothetical protein
MRPQTKHREKLNEKLPTKDASKSLIGANGYFACGKILVGL